MTRRHRRRTCPHPAAPATLPDEDDILSEILLRLPPQPSSLPRASLVCKRWRCLVTASHFRRSFRARHRNPPPPPPPPSSSASSKDGNFPRGDGSPRRPDPNGAGMGKKVSPRGKRGGAPKL
ncbi:unnamed protein product [Urochloa humidicola]